MVLTPDEVAELTGDGTQVYVAKGAGYKAGFDDEDYAKAGALITETSGIQERPWIRPEEILGIADRELDPAPPATTTRSDNYYQK